MPKHTDFNESLNPLIQAIIALEEELATQSLPTDFNRRLLELIDQCVEQGQDQILAGAVQLALDVDDMITAEFLGESINRAAERSKVDLSSEQHSESILFAIPMIFFTRVDQKLPSRISDPERIARLFETFDFINPQQPMIIHDELFTLEELTWLPSQVRRINHQLTRMTQQGFRTSKQAATLKNRKLGSNGSEGSIALRFLIGAVLTVNPSVPSFCDDTESESYASKFDRWFEAFKMDMMTQTQHELYGVATPKAYYASLGLGIRFLSTTDFYLTAANEAVAHKATKALISEHGIDGVPNEIRVAFFTDHEELLKIYVWPLLMPQVVNEVREDIMDILRKVNISPILSVTITSSREFKGSVEKYFGLMQQALTNEHPPASIH